MQFDKVSWRPLTKEVSLGEYVRFIALAYGAAKAGVIATSEVVKWINKLIGESIFDSEPEEHKFNMKVDFVDITLGEEDKEAILVLAGEPTLLLGHVEDTVAAGYKFTLRWDVKSKCFALFLFGGDNTVNKGKCLSSRGRSFIKALAALVHKHLVIKGAGAWEEGDKEDDDWFS